MLGVAGVYLNPCTADSAHYACVLTTLLCLGRLREAVVLRVKVSSSSSSGVRAEIQKERTEALRNYVHSEMEHSSATR